MICDFQVVYTLRESLSPAVQYETANTLVILSKSHVAIGAGKAGVHP